MQYPLELQKRSFLRISKCWVKTTISGLFGNPELVKYWTEHKLGYFDPAGWVKCLTQHQGRSQGVARGGRGHHWPKLGHPFGHPTQNCRFCPFFFLTRNTFIKTRNRRISLWPRKTGDFTDVHFSFASAPGVGQTSVERNRNQMSFSRTTVNCGLMRYC